MNLSRLSRRLFGWIARPLRQEHSPRARLRGPRTIVIVLDGTMSTLEAGYETHAGVTYRLCSEMGSAVSVYYEAGVQWQSWRGTLDVLMGRGINRQIRRAYGYLASHYHPGDRIYLMGYSRGAYAVRSLAGVIDQVGLVKAEHANVRNIRTAYRHYQMGGNSDSEQAFVRRYCHDVVPIEMVGVWDTVVMWECPDVFPGRVEQVWFSGAHGDVGGQLGGFEAARPLANISLVWMLDRAAECGLPLPDGWRNRFYTDKDAPSVGTWRSWGKIFLLRKARIVGRDATERLHETVRPQDYPVPHGLGFLHHGASQPG